ncbi:MAG: serine hydrolase domain-containing protein [Nocardioidaceae bacterium]
MGGTIPHEELAELAERNGFSGQVVVRTGDDLVYSGCFGLADRAHRVPVRENTRFGVASFTKMFTACAVAGLVTAGELTFDTPLTEALPSAQRPRWLPADVTVHHALSHTSGLSDYLEEDTFEGDEADMFARVMDGRSVQSLRDTADFLPLLDRVHVRPAPAHFAYSSTGYILLGLVVEHLAGAPYRTVVQDRVLDPLGIGPAFPALDEVWDDVAVGYLPPLGPGRPWRSNVFSLPPLGGPDGGAFLTATEITTFLHAYARDEVVPGLRDRMVAPAGTDADGDHYGYGVWILGDAPEGWIGHSGFDPGFECEGWHRRATDTTLAMTANVNHASAEIYELVRRELGASES